MDTDAISFGPFRFLAAQRLLFEGDRPVRLGSRALDILTALVERAGEVVSKEELMARAWPQAFVEESNLKIQVSVLRRALGDGQGGHRYIVTVPGRGYNFVTQVRTEKHSSASPQPMAGAAEHNLPHALTRVIGREEVVAGLVARLWYQRLLTIVGPGGIGKTAVALAAAEHLIAEYEHGVWLIDLVPIADQRLVPSAVATVLGLRIRTENPLHDLIAGIGNRRMLLLLDNCEHVIDAVANLAAAVLNGAAGVNILATSREPLGVAGEHQYRLGPLDGPQWSHGVRAAEAAAFPAVQLFVERVSATVEDFVLTDANAPMVVEICRRLDGLPLAIEFAAPRVAVLGVNGLAARLDDIQPLLGVRRRPVVPRHRTMKAVVDWSYGLLSDDEQRFFRALGIFAGGFTVEAAVAVAMDSNKAPGNAIERLADLVTKSLVAADVSAANPRFRLLDTTRAFAIEKLDASGERERISGRHAAYYRSVFERAEGEAMAQPAGEWLADYGLEIDNVRSALDWAFSPGGDVPSGVALTAAAAPLWMRLSLLTECCSRARQALGGLETGGTRQPRAEMRLQAALGASTSEAAELGAAFVKALDIADSLGDAEYQLRALRGLYSYHAATGRYRAAAPFAERFHQLAATGAAVNAGLFGERMMGVAKHFLGDQRGAQRHLEQVLTHHLNSNLTPDDVRRQTDAYVIRFHADLLISSRVYLARVLWLRVFCYQAVRAAALSIEAAEATGHALSLCYALALAGCPISLWAGDLAAAARYAGMLLDHSSRHSLQLWNAFGSTFDRAVAIRRGDLDARPHPAADEVAGPGFSLRFLTGLIELAEALARAGQTINGLAFVDAGIEQSEPGWHTPELLRLKGELLLSQSQSGAAGTAETLFRQALDGARRQETLSWELRAARSLARLLRDQGRRLDAIACLEPVHERFTEGFGTADLIEAKRLLDELHDAGRS
jgi:predicted ATPase/DNA-binding winged helix-turn-helix (wHTH) protein